MTAPTQTRVRRCLAVIAARLATIRIDNGYQTDAGLNVFLGREDLHADSSLISSCCSILEGDESVGDSRPGQTIMVLPVTIHAPTASNPDAPLDAGHALLGDLQKALFGNQDSGSGEDRLDGNAISFNFLGRDILPRDDGGKTTSVFIDTEVRYPLCLSNPYK